MDDIIALESQIYTQMIKFNAQSTNKYYFFTKNGLYGDYSDIEKDAVENVVWSVILVTVYLVFAMGSLSPIHSRSLAAVVAVMCVGISYTASAGFLAYVGAADVSELNWLLPSLLLAIGVPNLLVICDSIDQTDPSLPVGDRMQQGMKLAGVSVTMTSLTNAVGFFMGASSSLPGLSKFCLYGGIGVLFLHFTSMTIFTAFMVYDITR